MNIDTNKLEELISECIGETAKAARESYDASKAEKTAGLFLLAQMQSSLIIEQFELEAKQAKNEIDRVCAEKYLQCKEENTAKKVTENTIDAFVSASKEVIEAKSNAAKAESRLRKWLFISNSLKDGIIYFRNIGKSNGSF